MVIVKPLVKKVDFFEIKKKNKKSTHFVCFFNEKSQSSATPRLNKETKQLGFIIPKKVVKKSSSRNLIKRWARELIKTNETLAKAILVVRNLPDLSTKKSKKEVYKELKLLISLVT